MENVIPLGIDRFLLALIPFIILIFTLKYFFKKKNLNLSRFERILVSLIVSSILSILYIGFDAVLKSTHIVGGCFDWCGLENALYASLVGFIGFIALIILLIKIFSKKADINNNSEIQKTDLYIIYATSIILFLELLINLYSSDIFSIIKNEDFLGIIIELLNGPILKNLYLMTLISLVFLLRKSIFLTKLMMYLSLVFLFFSHYAGIGYYFLKFFHLNSYSLKKILFLFVKIILIYFIYKNTKNKSSGTMPTA